MDLPYEELNFAFSLATIAVTIALLVLARRNLAATFFAVYLGGLGLTGLDPVWRLITTDMAALARWLWITQTVMIGGLIAFAIVYPNAALNRARRLALGVTAAVIGGGVLTLLLLDDAQFHDPVTGARPVVPFVGSLTGAANVVAIAFLGARWLTSKPGTYRTQLAWAILPASWWVLHDGLGFAVYPWVLGRSGAPGAAHPVLATAAWVNMGGIVFTLGLMSIALWRTMRGRGAGDDRALGLVLLYLLPLTLVQMLDPEQFGGPGPYHILLDYAVVPLAVYGVLRHRVVDIDLKLKHGIKHSTIAAAFLVVFFVVATVAQEFLAETLGWLAGGVAAGALLFAIAPIHRAAERLSNAALPHAREEAGYLTYRRYQIYRVALEGTLRDGVVDPSEASALRSLRDELGLTMDDHRALETDARGRIQARPA